VTAGEGATVGLLALALSKVVAVVGLLAVVLSRIGQPGREARWRGGLRIMRPVLATLACAVRAVAGRA
jgi:hypothetical protein